MISRGVSNCAKIVLSAFVVLRFRHASKLKSPTVAFGLSWTGELPLLSGALVKDNGLAVFLVWFTTQSMAGCSSVVEAPRRAVA